MKWLRRLFVLVICAIVFVFAMLAVNQEPVVLRFLDWRTPELSLFWWLLVAFAAGSLFGLGATLLMTVRGAARKRALARQVKAQDKELQQLKNLAAAD